MTVNVKNRQQRVYIKIEVLLINVRKNEVEDYFMNELISIVIPIYNVEKYLEKCLSTVVNQTYENLEIILVDDGSVDNSGKICDKYKEKDLRIKVIHKENGGLSDARNVGIKVATGKYIAFLDADDYVALNMYEKLYNIVKKEKAEIGISGYSRIDENNKETQYPLDAEKYPKDRNILCNMIGTLPTEAKDINIGMSVWKCLYNLDIIKENKLFFKSEKVYISEDIIFQIEYFGYVNKVGLVRDPLYKYRYHENSLSIKYKEDRFEKQKVLYLKEKDMLEKKGWLNAEVRDRLNRTFLMKTKACIKSEVLGNKGTKKNRLENISNILNDELLTKVIEQYPIKKINFKLKIYILMIKFKLGKLLYKIYDK